METREWILTLLQQTCLHGNQMSDFPENAFFVDTFLYNVICLNFTFSTIFLVNNDHRAIKYMLIRSNIAELGTVQCQTQSHKVGIM